MFASNTRGKCYFLQLAFVFGYEGASQECIAYILCKKEGKAF